MFVDNWISSFGSFLKTLADNSPQVTSKFSQVLCAEILYSIADDYGVPSTTNKQVEWYNATVVFWLLQYVIEHQWD